MDNKCKACGFDITDDPLGDYYCEVCRELPGAVTTTRRPTRSFLEAGGPLLAICTNIILREIREGRDDMVTELIESQPVAEPHGRRR